MVDEYGLMEFDTETDEWLVQTYAALRSLIEAMRAEAYHRMEDRSVASIKGDTHTMRMHRADPDDPEDRNYLYLEKN